MEIVFYIVFEVLVFAFLYSIAIIPMILEKKIRRNLTDENIHKAWVINDKGKKRFDIEGVGVKDVYNELGTRGRYYDGFVIGKSVFVYWFDIMENPFYRILYGGAIPIYHKKKFSAKNNIFYIFYIALMTAVIILMFFFGDKKIW